MKKILFALAAFTILFGCSDDDHNKGDNPGIENPNLSANGKIEFVRIYQAAEGPHDMMIIGNKLYTKREHTLSMYSIADPENPDHEKFSFMSDPTNVYGRMYTKNFMIFVPNYGGKYIAVYDNELNSQTSYVFEGLDEFRPRTMLIDSNNVFWVGGSDGAKGILVKCSLQMNYKLVVEASWTASFPSTAIEDMFEKENYVIVSLANGDVYSFSKNNISIGPVSTASYENEPGHEKWGRTLLPMGNQTFFANWGAGFATVKTSNPLAISFSNIITNSNFKYQFPDSEGTDVYDVVYNSTKDVLCVANGWGGVFLVSPDNPGIVLDYIDIKGMLNHSIATKGYYIYTGNTSGGEDGYMKGIGIFKLK